MFYVYITRCGLSALDVVVQASICLYTRTMSIKNNIWTIVLLFGFQNVCYGENYTITPGMSTEEIMANGAEALNKARQTLVSLERNHDPCYATHLSNEVRRLQGNSGVHYKESCTPLKIRAEWNLEDLFIDNGAPDEDVSVKFKVVETYPGALITRRPGKKVPGIKFDTEIEIQGGCDLTYFGEEIMMKAQPEFLEVNASLLNWKFAGMFRGETKRRVQVRNTNLLETRPDICSDNAGLLFTSQLKTLSITPFDYQIKDDKCAQEPWTCGGSPLVNSPIHGAYLYQAGADSGWIETFQATPAKLFSDSDASKLRKGETIERKFPVKLKHDSHSNQKYLRSGDVTVQISEAKAIKPGMLIVTPGGEFRSRRDSAEEPYMPRSKDYHLKNTGEETLSYQVLSGAKWLSLSNTAGDLEAGQSTVVKFQLKKSADEIESPHKITVKIDNVTDHKGSTTRDVKLSESQKWQYTVSGHDTLFFGSDIAGGIRLPWQTVVEFEIEDGVYKGGKGSTKLLKEKTFSKPAGVFDCMVIKGSYIDSSQVKHKTPYIKSRAYSVQGSVQGKQVSLYIPSNEYAVDFHCVTDTDALGSRIPDKWWRERTVKSTRKEGKFVDVVPLPSGKKIAPLKHGWSLKAGKYGTKNSMNYETAWMIRLK